MVVLKSSPAFAKLCLIVRQSPRSLSIRVGRVFDEGGGVVPGASVTVIETRTGVGRETLTNAAGQYTVPYLPVGTYDVGHRQQL